MEFKTLVANGGSLRHMQHIENSTTMEEYLLLESFGEIPPKPPAWTLEDSTHKTNIL